MIVLLHTLLVLFTPQLSDSFSYCLLYKVRFLHTKQKHLMIPASQI